jgi:putative hemin transport protein
MRDIAQTLGVSEAALLASACGEGKDTVRLTSDFAAQFAELGALGRVMALTRNLCAVIEKIGLYENLEHGVHASQVIGSDIDLRIFFQRFHVAFAVTTEGPRGTHRSLQFFDAQGDAVHKVHLLPDSNIDAFAQLVERFTSQNQSPIEPSLGNGAAVSKEAAKDVTQDAAIDLQALRTAYAQMQDTHEFFGLLRRFQLRRTQALRLLGKEAARPVERLSLRALLHAAAESQLPIMIFVGNPGVIQIHSGPVRTLKQYGPWFNVMDPGFNLHVNEALIENAWAVRKPTSDGLVSSLELYDAAGEPVLLAFSKRKPGQAESEHWRELLQRLADLSLPGG